MVSGGKVLRVALIGTMTHIMFLHGAPRYGVHKRQTQHKRGINQQHKTCKMEGADKHFNRPINARRNADLFEANMSLCHLEDHYHVTHLTDGV